MSAQIFSRNANAILLVSIAAIVLLIVGIISALIGLYLSPWYTGVGDAIEQPVPFSHKHHVDQLMIDCRYCHSTVERVAHAGIPSTDTCMSCHSQIWTNSPLLQPVRDSYQTGEPVLWNRVYDLPDFVYFNHSVHVAKGIGCASCHGRIDQQHLTAKAQPLYMGWCLGCHRAPEEHIRPRDEVFNMAYEPQMMPIADRLALVQEYQIPVDGRLTHCYTCHR
ncbi:cytochrome c3 family protein [Candidatus Chloroploca sp. Khr17]|uniref:cytochrome c3 family protein n=1 Tax=Candidatus Chloroploca sp. Khr17 TaxID=2496869 RepID=UPI00101D21B4|nr:cytochrome c3 family protein [Candidatus Chloroploca sp. Khr17]